MILHSSSSPMYAVMHPWFQKNNGIIVQEETERKTTATERNPWARVFIRDHSKLGSITYLFLNVRASHATIPSLTTSSPKSMIAKFIQTRCELLRGEPGAAPRLMRPNNTSAVQMHKAAASPTFKRMIASLQKATRFSARLEEVAAGLLHSSACLSPFSGVKPVRV